MRSYPNACSCLLAYLVTSSLDWLHSSTAGPSAWFTRQQLAKLDLSAIAASFPHIVFSVIVRDLGITLDQELTFVPHLNRLCHECYYQLRLLRFIFLSLTSTATATLVHAFVSARLDYCSTLYAGLLGLRLSCLQRVIRTACLPHR